MGERDKGLHLAELVATLSLAADLGLGQPAEHAIRSCLVALKLGDEIGLGPDDRATAYWVNLLAWIGCTADSHELAKLFRDDTRSVPRATRSISPGSRRWASLSVAPPPASRS